MSDLTVTIERNPFRWTHVEGAPGAYRVIVHPTGYLPDALEIATGPTEVATLLDAAARLHRIAARLEAEARR